MGALDGIRVLDAASMMAGPYGATLLADLGAEVIKLEPLNGDESRRIGPRKGLESGVFVGVNRNKRSVAADLRTEGGREVLRALVRWADVVIDNLRGPAKRRLGLDFDSLRSENPRVISVSVSTFGETGPYAGRPGIDPVAQALSGFMGVTGEPGGRPLKAGPPIGDAVSSLLVAYGALAALWARERTGEGQAVEVALINGLIHVQAPYTGQYFLLDRVQPRTGNSIDWYAPYNSFRCKDGAYVQIACYNDKFFANLCHAIGRPELPEDPDFATNEARLSNRERLESIIAGFFATRTQAEALGALGQHDVIAAPVNLYPETFADPQVLHNGMVQDVNHAALGPLRVTGVPVQMSATPGSVRRPPPALGEHTQEVLAELGFSKETIQRWLSDGSVAAMQPEAPA
jgi:crotonobetainyl-CoA:carnitine CoA-transferase CaiB-like acyl-CoA transferase